jgi:rare lipoprotein A (peptidoglycan hydrolase)
MAFRSLIKTPSLALAASIATACLACLGPACWGLTAGAQASTGTQTGGAIAGSGSATSKPKIHHPAGIATWFGPGFYGQQTACGQTLTPAVVGVANRTLPCGTLVQVNFKGRSLVVPVLDRGPYSNHASWDLTAGAAQKLEITETVRITAHIVGSEANTPLLGSPPVTPAEAATGGAQASASEPAAASG